MRAQPHTPPRAPSWPGQSDWPDWRRPPETHALFWDWFAVQPVHALRDAALLGAEARGGHGWTRSARSQLTAMLLHLACYEAGLWQGLAGTASLTVAARLPAGAICDTGLVDQVAAALAGTGLEAGLLELGVCRPASQPAGPGELLAWSALRDMGVGIMLELSPEPDPDRSQDWAGLTRLPFTSLRLPPCLTAAAETGPSRRRAVREAVRAAQRQDAAVIAAGVRTHAQRDLLAELGCDAAQGRLFGAPMHPAAFHAALGQCAPA